MSGKATPGSAATTSHPPTIRARILHEMRRYLILFLYLWALFGLFVLDESIVERSHGDAFVFQGFAVLNAFVLAKVMLVAEHLDLAGWLRRRALAWTIVFEAALCTLLFMLVHTLERLIAGALHGERVAATTPTLGGGGLAGVVVVAAIVFVSLLPFFTFKHVARAIGPDRMQAILLASRSAAPPCQPKGGIE